MYVYRKTEIKPQKTTLHPRNVYLPCCHPFFPHAIIRNSQLSPLKSYFLGYLQYSGLFYTCFFTVWKISLPSTGDHCDVQVGASSSSSRLVFVALLYRCAVETNAHCGVL